MPDNENDMSDELLVLRNMFIHAYTVFRDAWRKTGGDVDMELKIRDAAEQKDYLRRSEAARKGAENRKRLKSVKP